MTFHVLQAAAWWGFHYGINGGKMAGKGDGRQSKLARSVTWMCTSTGLPVFCTSVFLSHHRLLTYVYHLFWAGLKIGDDKERMMTTIYKAVMSEDGKTVLHVEPHSMSQYGQNKSVVTDCLSGNPGSARTGPFSPGVSVPCVDGKQTWTGYYFPGLLTDTSKVVFDKSIQGKWRVPANLHVGCMGLAPSEVDFVSSIPPMPYGGNLDDRRIGVGATMYYPIAVKGALISMGDAHLAQGDGD